MEKQNIVNSKVCVKRHEKMAPRLKGAAERSRTQFRNAFTMQSKPGFAEEYKKRHDALRSELSQVLFEAGISDYCIYLDEETNPLFAFQKPAPGNTARELPKKPVVRRGWDYMADMMAYDEDNMPVAVPLREMFRME